MKKFIAIVAVFAVLIGCYSTKKEFCLKDYFDGTYYCYTENPVNDDSINLGFCFLNYTESSSPMGESMYLQNFEPSSAITKLGANIVKTEYLQTGATIIYAFTNKISTNVNLDGEKVNLQFACYDDHCVIGWPLILGSY